MCVCKVLWKCLRYQNHITGDELFDILRKEESSYLVALMPALEIISSPVIFLQLWGLLSVWYNPGPWFLLLSYCFPVYLVYWCCFYVSTLVLLSNSLHASLVFYWRKLYIISVIFVSVNAGAVLKGTNVSGVYGCHSGNNSVNFEHLCYREVVSRGSSFMDIMAITYCEENAIPGWYYLIIIIYSFLMLTRAYPENLSLCSCDFWSAGAWKYFESFMWRSSW